MNAPLVNRRAVLIGASAAGASVAGALSRTAGGEASAEGPPDSASLDIRAARAPSHSRATEDATRRVKTPPDLASRANP